MMRSKVSLALAVAALSMSSFADTAEKASQDIIKAMPSKRERRASRRSIFSGGSNWGGTIATHMTSRRTVAHDKRVARKARNIRRSKRLA